MRRGLGRLPKSTAQGVGDVCNDVSGFCTAICLVTHGRRRYRVVTISTTSRQVGAVHTCRNLVHFVLSRLNLSKGGVVSTVTDSCLRSFMGCHRRDFNVAGRRFVSVVGQVNWLSKCSPRCREGRLPINEASEIRHPSTSKSTRHLCNFNVTSLRQRDAVRGGSAFVITAPHCDCSNAQLFCPSIQNRAI